ncbi:phage head morphogenesis protein [Candidatus Pacearchaeota archaeon]|jgi:SPP1 gp7 family putative phage head morphogenesis protein|nr:phage head morphogenesis protein [Candidatus Pacearchaeota archaeon]
MADTPIQVIGDEYALKISEAFQQWAKDAQAAYPRIVPFDPTILIRAALLAAGAVQKAELEELLGVGIKYNLISPEAIDWCKKYGASQIKLIDQGTRNAINQITLRGLQNGLSPFEQKKAIRQIIGLLPRQLNALEAFKSSLGEIDNVSLDRIVNREAKRLLNQRAATIGLTESHSATNQGAIQVTREASRRGVISVKEYQLEWFYTADKRTCDRCKSYHGTRAELDGSFPNGLRCPPAHPRCRCVTIIVKR